MLLLDLPASDCGGSRSPSVWCGPSGGEASAETGTAARTCSGSSFRASRHWSLPAGPCPGNRVQKRSKDTGPVTREGVSKDCSGHRSLKASNLSLLNRLWISFLFQDWSTHFSLHFSSIVFIYFVLIPTCSLGFMACGALQTTPSDHVEQIWSSRAAMGWSSWSRRHLPQRIPQHRYLQGVVSRTWVEH